MGMLLMCSLNFLLFVLELILIVWNFVELSGRCVLLICSVIL